MDPKAISEAEEDEAAEHENEHLRKRSSDEKPEVV